MDAIENTATMLTGRYRTPDIKVVQYLAPIDVARCNADLIAASIGTPDSAAIVCTNINAIANPLSPPDSFTDSSWEEFKTSQEYRGYIHISSFEYQLENGKIVNFTQPTSEFNYGYTRLPLPSGLVFEEAEPYTGSAFNNLSSTLNDTADTLIVTEQRAQRIATARRIPGINLTGYDAPFVFLRLNQTIKADGSPIKIDIERSIFPSVRVYLNNQLQAQQLQTNLAEFIISGGLAPQSSPGNFIPLPVGVGNFGPSGLDINLSVSQQQVA
ncbi:MAG TPA: hypothetical protein DCY88_34380 [Cyanobacteria bacterium UBA11372]|nr:hypothetical protein [Cyanobacteria bacterium UBA11372]